MGRLVGSSLVACLSLLPLSALGAATQDLGLPLVASSRSGPCEMMVVGDGTTFAVQVTGLVPGERLDITDQSVDEIVRNTAKAAEDGTYFVITLPQVVGRKNGRATMQVKASRCTTKASYDWHE